MPASCSDSADREDFTGLSSLLHLYFLRREAVAAAGLTYPNLSKPSDLLWQDAPLAVDLSRPVALAASSYRCSSK